MHLCAVVTAVPGPRLCRVDQCFFHVLLWSFSFILSSFASLFFRFRGFFPGFTELGLLSFATGDFEEAAKLFEAAVVGDPKAGRTGGTEGTGKHRLLKISTR